eukprot:TRINITY_DN9146_c0_g2_i2.p1 TRINITY_DN9146_c0_g2~~TRINITY_DN9146_c0_g2_i2.p1  ORF type:complete len:280 (-),score=71.87 TRINITY_DN9146_c0_g2_i2:91-882(-)
MCIRDRLNELLEENEKLNKILLDQTEKIKQLEKLKDTVADLEERNKGLVNALGRQKDLEEELRNHYSNRIEETGSDTERRYQKMMEEARTSFALELQDERKAFQVQISKLEDHVQQVEAQADNYKTQYTDLAKKYNLLVETYTKLQAEKGSSEQRPSSEDKLPTILLGVELERVHSLRHEMAEQLVQLNEAYKGVCEENDRLRTALLQSSQAQRPSHTEKNAEHAVALILLSCEIDRLHDALGHLEDIRIQLLEELTGAQRMR